MSVLRKAFVFVAQSVAGPALEEVGRKVGAAIGGHLEKRLAPKPEKSATEKKEKPDGE